MPDDGVSGIPKFEEYRDPNAPPEEPAPPPPLYPSWWKWAVAGAVVGAFFGGVPEILAQMSRKVELAGAFTAALGPAFFWGVCGAAVGAIVGGLLDERARRQRKD